MPCLQTLLKSFTSGRSLIKLCMHVATLLQRNIEDALRDRLKNFMFCIRNLQHLEDKPTCSNLDEGAVYFAREID